MEKISGADHIKNILHSLQEERDFLHTMKQRKTNCIGHISGSNCVLKHVIEGEIEGRSDGKTRKKT